MPATVSLPEILQHAQTAFAEGLHTAMPGKIVSYNPATQTAKVQPMLKRAITSIETGEVSYEDLPAIDDVPVGFQRGGGFVLTLPITPGDFVFLIFSESSTGEYRTTGDIGEPKDTRRHSLGYPLAIPCGFPDTAKLSTYLAPGVGAASGTALVLGKESGPARLKIEGTFVQVGDGPLTDFAAMAAKVDSNFALVAVALGLINAWGNAHVHTGVVPGPGVGGPTNVPLVAPYVPLPTPALNAKIT